MWQRLSDIALAYRDFISGFEFTGTMGLEGPDWENPEPVPLPTDVFSPKFGYPVGTFRGRTRYVDLAERFTLMIAHLENFSETCLVLKGIAGQQLAGVPHTQEMTDFLKATVENYTITGYGGDRLYNGWFPQLYFENNRHDPFEPPSATWNPVVVDVHTNTLDTICYNDPGAILHEGTGRVQFMLTAVKHPDGSACAYGGPVMSHYEFTTPLGVRMSDEEWQTQLERGMEPPFAAWKQDFLVPAEGD